ncbi:reverse transcriptase domain-containing protein [Tanacetum coccineum]
MDSEATDASTQQNPKKMDEEFTIIAYPNVQENLKLPTEDQVIIEELASSTKTLSSLQNLDKELSFTNNSLWRSHRKKNLRKPILNQSLRISSCTTSNINNNKHNNHNNNISSTTTTSTISKHLRSNAIEAHWDLPTIDLKEILQQRMFEDNSYKAHDVHNDLYEALQKSLELDYSNQGLADQEEARKMKRKRRESPRTPPGSPPSQPPSPSPPTGALGALGTSGASRSSQMPPPPPPPSIGTSRSAQQQGGVAPSSSKTAASTHQSMAWTTSHTRYESTGFTATYETSPSDDLMHDDFILDEQYGKWVTCSHDPARAGGSTHTMDNPLVLEKVLSTLLLPFRCYLILGVLHERGIVIKNKARLVTQGYIQEKGIDYDEVFVHVARIEAIRLFLAYASLKDFVVYQMDVKSAFPYGKIEKEVYVCQPPGFEDPDFPDRVYKVEKALYGLHQAPRARMPFGLCNAPATFQRCMTAIFHDMVEDFMEVFMDDFSVFGNSFDQCLNNLDKMLGRCEETNLVLNWEKCHFMVKEGIVLGHKISGKGIEVDKAKINVIAKLPYPSNVKGVRSFLGHAGFYRRFIKDFSMISKPMTQLLMKDAKFDFSEDCKKAFNKLKEKLTTAPIIISLDWNEPFELMCDASDFAVGAVLGQRIDGKFKPIYYASKTLNDAQAHYTTIEKELLAVVFSFDKFLNEHLMKLKAKLNDEEPWYADYINYIVEKVVPPKWTPERRKRFFSQAWNYFLDEPFAFRLCPDNVMRRCVAENKILEILAHCHSSLTGGHHSASITRRKVYGA